MNKRILSLFLMIIISIPCIITGCTFNDNETVDEPIISNNTFKIGLILSSEDYYTNTSALIKQGFDFAYTLADTLNSGESIAVKTVYGEYSDTASLSLTLEEVYASGAKAVVTDATSITILEQIANFFAPKNIPVVNLSGYHPVNNNVFTLTPDYAYSASASATYAAEKGYTNIAVLAEDDSDFYTDYVSAFTDSLVTYANCNPTIYYLGGNSANYSPSALVGGNYQYIYLLCNCEDREEHVKDLRENGYSGEIMLGEVIDKQCVEQEVFNGCTFISKLESDNANNISSIFYKTFSEHLDISQSEVSAASAYGYDAYMTIFEALKNYAGYDSYDILNNVSGTTASTTAKVANEITASDLTEAIRANVYYGVTDIIKFGSNYTIPTYLYINNIVDSKSHFSNKYTFN